VHRGGFWSDLSAEPGGCQRGQRPAETVNRAIEQYREINRLDPSDTESALWLARL